MNWQALASGLAGALELTAMHEIVRRQTDIAPRMDVLGERAIARSMEKLGYDPPSERCLNRYALLGDILSNSIYYSFVGMGRPQGAMLRGMLLGLAAGAGAVVLPGRLGLGEEPSNRTRTTQAMTVGYYLLGGLAAAAAYISLAHQRPRSPTTRPDPRGPAARNSPTESENKIADWRHPTRNAMATSSHGS